MIKLINPRVLIIGLSQTVWVLFLLFQHVPRKATRRRGVARLAENPQTVGESMLELGNGQQVRILLRFALGVE